MFYYNKSYVFQNTRKRILLLLTDKRQQNDIPTIVIIVIGTRQGRK